MEIPFSPKGKGVPQGQLEGSTSLDGGTRNSMSDDMINNVLEFMNFDTYAGLCNIPTTSDQVLANGLPSFSPEPYPSSDGFNLVEQRSGALHMTEVSGNYNAMQGSSSSGEKAVFHQVGTQLGFSDDANNMNSRQHMACSFEQFDTSGSGNSVISRLPVAVWSLEERMLGALSFLKESAGGGILAQVWVPIRHGDQFILSTSEQPYLLDQMLAGYREVSRTFTFSAEGKPGCFLGLPGRVFISKLPEWTSNVGYYNKTEYLRVDHAISHEVRGSIAVPVFDLHSEMACYAVLELVTTKEKPDFDKELEIVCHALQLVNLRTALPPRLLPQCLSNNKRAALTEIVDVLRVVCHAHRLPLALTWIPCYYTEGIGDETTGVRIRDGNSNSSEKCVLCIEESACYINDRVMEGFVHACVEHYLEEGQGIAGKALQSNHPFFYSDVKTCDISEYPLVHHARKCNLNAAVAIRLRSTHTNDDDYILEFFLPVNMRGSSEQQLLLDNLSGTMQRICRSLRTVSEAELLSGIEGSPVGIQKEKVPGFFPLSRRNSQSASTDGDHDVIGKTPLKASNLRNNGTETTHNQAMSSSRRQAEKKRSSAEKNVSLSVLQQYFSGSLKDAAKSIGVCPTTLKRICRQHGISRWPSRKINKVNRSLKKIQTVLDSVQGVEGGLKFDPSTGGFVAGSSIIQEVDAQKSLLFPEKSMSLIDTEPLTQDAVSVPVMPFSEAENSAVKMEDYDVSLAGNQLVHLGNALTPNSCEQELKANVSADSSEDSKANFLENSVEGDDGIVEHTHPTSSMTDSSNGSASMMHDSSSGSQSFENQKHFKAKSSSVDSGSKITVKANYREDTIRFKFDPSVGCFQLYEEVAARFKLQNGTFQLKYLDDEEEWVMLVNDSDLQECVEILNDMGKRSVKFLVRDIPFVLSSSGSSSCFLR